MKNWNIGDDILDTQDLEERIEELEEELEGYHPEAFTAFLNLDDDELDAMFGPNHRTLAESVFEDLHALILFKEQLEDYCDWRHGETLIHENYQEAYAKQLADDIGTIDSNANWPLQHIDWKAAADELFRWDYTSAEIDGHTYYARVC